jgi:microsomal dipeptidase-like Zn-dependent dipeptidase
MELLVDVHHVETRLFRDNVSFGARQVHSSHQTYHRLRNHFGHTRW